MESLNLTSAKQDVILNLTEISASPRNVTFKPVNLELPGQH